ncbi:hypothetical protein HF086_011323 [Spodoptera exigua]|uniref:Rab-GAP TBC domain-containing protein n=1 Tax=Spodoptera exigua TaxID=7107 RepID=A0A922S986_SPOEX|nr:hypothetical protein HF086_011323 [Spodoptera exigua]
MEGIKEEAIHHTALKLAEEIKNLSIYKSFYSDVQKLVSSPNVKKEDFKQTLQQAMKEKGLDTKLRNTVFHWVRTQSKQNKLDPLTSLLKASAQWEKRIHKSLNSMCTDLETSLAKIRPQSEQEELSDKWNELSTYTLEWAQGEPLLGVNPNMPSSVPGFSTLEAERISLGERVAALGYAPVVQEYLKKGSPQCLRAKLWSQVLGSEVKGQQTAYFAQLKKNVLEVDLMIDKLIFKDVQLTASNDDQYFVFEDLLYQVMLCFSRDIDVMQQLKGSIGNPPTVTIKGKQTSAESMTVFPPSGIIPFHGFTMYATPFCYLYDDPVQLYYTFRAFYGIVSLCLLYERLLEANEPLLWIHFRNININPIRVVFKWLMRAFSGHLPPDQLLLLWDAILGYDCLEILPLLALAILSFRKENIFQVNTLQNVDAVLADLSTISVIPLLQLALMKP